MLFSDLKTSIQELKKLYSILNLELAFLIRLEIIFDIGRL